MIVGTEFSFHGRTLRIGDLLAGENSGGFGEVRLVEGDPNLLIKVFFPGKEPSGEFVTRLVAAFGAFSRKHPSIIAGYPLSLIPIANSNQFGLLMMACGDEDDEHSTLAQFIFDNYGSLLENSALSSQIARSIASDVACFHHAGIIVGDLKPENIILLRNRKTNAYRISWVDLDSFAIVADGETHSVQARSAEYSAPELRETAVPTFESDAFSLAIVVLLTICGVSPFEYATRAQPHAPIEHRVSRREAWLTNPTAYERNMWRGRPLSDWDSSLATCVRESFGPNPSSRPNADAWKLVLTERNVRTIVSSAASTGHTLADDQVKKVGEVATGKSQAKPSTPPRNSAPIPKPAVGPSSPGGRSTSRHDSVTHKRPPKSEFSKHVAWASAAFLIFAFTSMALYAPMLFFRGIEADIGDCLASTSGAKAASVVACDDSSAVGAVSAKVRGNVTMHLPWQGYPADVREQCSTQEPDSRWLVAGKYPTYYCVTPVGK